MFLGVNGPINIYTHSKYSCLHSLEQAESDLNSDVIDCALICSAFSLEDALLSLRTQQSSLEKTLSEGAGVMILTKDKQATDWGEEIQKCRGDINYGITTHLINLIKLIKKGE